VSAKGNLFNLVGLERENCRIILLNTFTSSERMMTRLKIQMDEIALSIGRAVLGLAFLFGWFYIGCKGSDSGSKILEWGAWLTLPVIIILGFMGVFR